MIIFNLNLLVKKEDLKFNKNKYKLKVRLNQQIKKNLKKKKK